jgi:hypothetical protein
MLSAHEDAIARAVAALDFDAIKREYDEQDGFIFIRRFLPVGVVDDMVGELRRLPRRAARRTWVPLYRKGAAIAHDTIAQGAPLMYALYRSPSFREFASRLAEKPLELKSERDAHAAALYLYQRAGDHVGFHYDDCGCEGFASYTATLGLINRTTSTVHFQLARRTKELHVAMTPGSLVFFCGAKAYHRVMPLARGEERVAYSFAYVTDGGRLQGKARLYENLKDAILYFGPRGLFSR